MPQTSPTRPPPPTAAETSPLARHPLVHAGVCVAVILSVGFAGHALWLWKNGERHLSPSDPGIVLIAAVFQSWVLSWAAALVAAWMGFNHRQRLVWPVRWMAFIPAAALAIDFLAGRAIGYR